MPQPAKKKEGIKNSLIVKNLKKAAMRKKKSVSYIPEDKSQKLQVEPVPEQKESTGEVPSQESKLENQASVAPTGQHLPGFFQNHISNLTINQP